MYGIVDQSGGTITVRSAPNKGSTFVVDLPLVAAPAEQAEAEPADGSVGGSETVLLVEDEEFLRDLARRMLELAGYTVLTAADGEEALALVDAHDGTVHLVLTDVVMPGISGRELADRLGARHGAVKILFTSGYTDDVIVRKGLVEHTTHFLRKPYSMDDLTRKVREVLDTPSAEA